MATILFAVLLVAGWLIVRGSGRGTVLAAWTVSLCAILLLFNYHVGAKLPLNF